MKKLIALLLAALLMTPVALMEADEAALDAPVAADAVDAAVEELSDDLGDGDAPEPALAEMDFVSEGAAGIPIDAAHFPDAAFRQYVASQCDKGTSYGPPDGVLSDEECQGITDIYVVGLGVASMQGIEYFPNVTKLDCQNNNITALDVSACPQLVEIVDDAYSSDIGYRTQDYARLLFFDGKVTLTAGAKVVAPVPLDEAHFPDAAFRQSISVIFDANKDGYVSRHEERLNTSIYVDKQDIKSLQGIEYFPDITVINCQLTKITSLNVNGFTNLQKLMVNNNDLTSLDFSNCPNLTEIDCTNNKLTSLVIDGCSKLEKLICYNNKLTSLTFANDCPNLTSICCNGNKLTSIDLSNLPEYLAKFKDVKGKLTNKHIKGWWLNKNRIGEPLLGVDPNMRVIGLNGTPSSPAVPASFANSSEGVTVTVDAASTANNTVASVVATQGATTQIDLSGATGKKFKSSNKKVVTVNKNGVVTVKGSGKAKITYKVGKKTRKVTLNVTDTTFPTTLSLNLTGTVDAKVGQPVTLVAAMNEGAVSGIKWKSSKKKVATVKNGVVTFKKPGTVRITATTTRGKLKASVTFRVTK